MSQLLINDYLSQLDLIKKISGSQRETIVREAFKDLLKAWGKQQGLVFLAEYPLKTATKTSISVDGALLHELRMPLGYWEAKDAQDKLDEEIAKKFRRGYPQDNIVFSDDASVVLWQHRQEVMRCAVEDTAALEKLLKLFFGYERPEIASFRAAVAQFKSDLPAVLDSLRQMIDGAHRSNKSFRAAEDKFLAHAQEAINPLLSDADVREMLIQHILTEEIFAKVFDDSDFHHQNNVASELYALEAEFFTGALKKNTLKGLDAYYAAIRAAAAQIGSHGEKQAFLKVIYENFYKVYNTKAADRLGVVYTPNEIVRFMIDGADWLCEQHFGKNLIDKDVDILDPATGTGTYICELLEHFRGQPKKLAHKYQHELHANEVAILPYYVANLNIEATYAAITGSYAEFPNLCFVDTLDNVGLHTAARGTTGELFGSVSEENVERIRRQNSRRISVVIGNPPYNANQQSENDNNKNREYPHIDARIKQTYIAESTAQKTKLYDMYARFFRWASDRLDANGILAFVTNRSFLDARTFDGFRKTVAQEFSDIYVVDLGGDVRANPKLSGTRHNVFGIQTGVAISFLVKRQQATKDKRPARVYYARRPELETAEEKLAFLASQPLRALAFDEVSPDKSGNWLNLTHNDFDSLIPLASKETKAAKTGAKERAIFKLFSLGVSTNRDEWVVGNTKRELASKVQFFLRLYDRHVGRPDEYDTRIKWSRNLKRRAQQRRIEPFDPQRVYPYIYRPFTTRLIYASDVLVDEPGAMREFIQGRTLCLSMSSGLRVLAGGAPFDLHYVGDTYGLPLRRHDAQNNVVDNITDWGLKQFIAHYKGCEPSPQPSPSGRGSKTGARKITKEAIFHYCYAVLHDPVYCEKYAQNLKREFPRIPFYADFWRWADWGAELMRLHIDYESVQPFELTRHDEPDVKARAAGLAPKPLLKSDPAAGSILLDSETTLRGVPPEAWAYRLGNRSALDWVLDQHKEKKPKDPTIREEFYTYRFADHKEKVIDLLQRVVMVSVKTVKVVQAMQTAAR
ncbi:MAG: N-6 DNA methylase [Alicycliphilus sp.]|jgi:predicted helicase|uniref:site-specific DNA-methyltransferase (adenine-specific) n=1 Tax=Diaphorobacter limosus TaxID=3036128 RepID=A0ABZ0IYR2_9BURK|nr:type ISP restriction/modification enzyme [Diaphorobacter sp. Y-1]MBP8778398.1 N-6 DNA methylase [Alicycliphilus sp.]MCA0440931.1 N-6 DNA methylase [Pseudomonadota bacterium]WOO31066.1 type ISP restriction/modification enzyme [Diaphorobacter sp. Y-1]